MNKILVLYIHGKGGSPNEAEHYKKIFPDCDVIGLDYKSFLPYENAEEISHAVKNFKRTYEKIFLVANSIGAFFAMNAGIDAEISKAWFISPIVDMERLIENLMAAENISEDELQCKGTIQTANGEILSWKYFSYVKENPLRWNVPTKILYGEKDFITPIETLKNFAAQIDAEITVMKDGEHWFHTEEQLNFLDSWIKNWSD